MKNIPMNDCILKLSMNLVCYEVDGESCKDCQFKKEIDRMDAKLDDCDRGSSNRTRKEAKLDDAEFAFESCADLIIDSNYLVRRKGDQNSILIHI